MAVWGEMARLPVLEDDLSLFSSPLPALSYTGISTHMPMLCPYVPERANPLDPLKSGGAQNSSIVHPQNGGLFLMMDPGKVFMQTLKVDCGPFRQGI